MFQFESNPLWVGYKEVNFLFSYNGGWFFFSFVFAMFISEGYLFVTMAH